MDKVTPNELVHNNKFRYHLRCYTLRLRPSTAGGSRPKSWLEQSSSSTDSTCHGLTLWQQFRCWTWTRTVASHTEDCCMGDGDVRDTVMPPPPPHTHTPAHPHFNDVIMHTMVYGTDIARTATVIHMYRQNMSMYTMYLKVTQSCMCTCWVPTIQRWFVHTAWHVA
jgi:hypothetical protein